MDVKSFITGVMVSLTGLMGCHKAAVSATAAKGANPAAESKIQIQDLGVLQMTNDYETYVSLGAGKDCRMVPKILDRKAIEITVTFETKKPDGKTTGLSILQLQGTAQKQFEVSVGDTDFTFVPQVAAD
jgi:hypothetical protein